MPMFFPGEHAGYDAWAASEAYHAKYLLGEPDPALAFALENSAKHGLMEITVSAPQGKYRGLRAAGKYLNLLVRALETQRVLEAGTRRSGWRGGYPVMGNW